VIAEYFAACGYVVLRCDDRGVGGSSGDASEQDFAGSVADIVNTCRWLARHPAVDPERIALLGHSEGGLIAAAAAPQTEARAVVMLAGPALPIEWILHEQARTLSVEAGATSDQIEHERRMNEEVFALTRSSRVATAVVPEIEQVIRGYLRSWPELPAVDDAVIDENARIMAGVVGAPAYRSLLQQEPTELLGRLDRALLAVYGGKDVQVPGVANAETCRRITARHGHATVRLFPEHNHLFQQAGTGSITEYEVLPPGPDTEVLRDIAVWLSAVHRSD
jgi:pimeloyl-ACP methyl ester carboxylesterase